MKLLKCKACDGEVEIMDNDKDFNKKIKCLDCGFNNIGETVLKKPEIIVIKKRRPME
jgi:hypothetical protein